LDSKWWYRLPGRIPAASAISWREVRRPEEAISEAADSRISVRRVPSGSAAVTRALAFFLAARRFGVTRTPSSKAVGS
jgi:hypothetical protein